MFTVKEVIMSGLFYVELVMFFIPYVDPNVRDEGSFSYYVDVILVNPDSQITFC